MCDNVQLWGWDKDEEVRKEERTKASRSSVDQNGDGFSTSKNYLINTPKPLLVDPNISVDEYQSTTLDQSKKKIKVAIIDSGIDFNHKGLAEFKWINTQEVNGDNNLDEYQYSANCSLYRI